MGSENQVKRCLSHEAALYRQIGQFRRLGFAGFEINSMHCP